MQARAWAVTAQRRHALIAAPTGSGKTLAAFLSAINELVVEGLAHGLDDAVQVLYVSPPTACTRRWTSTASCTYCAVRLRHAGPRGARGLRRIAAAVR